MQSITICKHDFVNMQFDQLLKVCFVLVSQGLFVAQPEKNVDINFNIILEYKNIINKHDKYAWLWQQHLKFFNWEVVKSSSLFKKNYILCK